MGEVAVFQLDTKDLIQYILVSGFRYKPFNIGKVRSRGIEVDCTWNMWRALNVSTSYTYMEAVDQTDDRNYKDKTIPGRPEHEWFSKLEWNGKRLNCFAEWRYLSGNYLTRANTILLPIRRTGNLGVNYRITELIQIGAEVKNITNDNIVDIQGFPLPLRSYCISLKLRK
ncbi:TonB-dependent receptor [bacterium]|nr:TonB-dependent receptor [bacterium]